MQLQSKRHRVLSQTNLLDGWSPVRRIHYEQVFRDGSSGMQDRDLNARADGVTVLLHSADLEDVILLRQPRIVATLRGDPTGETLEACSGMLGEGELPEQCALREVQEETGFQALSLRPVASVYASPGGSLELIHLFTALFSGEHLGLCGGLRSEGEDIEVVELALMEACDLMRQGSIRDARTMLLLQHLALRKVSNVS